tara:strand:- start:1083 stop:1931 length:849 start_codon:yes stop_codon:yes gene_type:complete
MSIPLLIDNIDFTKILISNVKTISDSRKNLYLNYIDNSLIIQLPELIYNNKIIENKEHYEILINLECKTKEKTTKVINLFTMLDNYFKELINSNKTQFFKTEIIKYKPIIRKNKDNSVYIKLKILKDNITNNNINITCNNSKIDIKELNENCYLKFLLNINAIWINKENFGIYIRPIGIKKSNLKQEQNLVNFIPDSDNQCNNTIMDSVIDTSINTICNNNNNNNPQTEKVLISHNNSDKINKSNTITISSYNNDDDMTTINFSTLNNINEEYDNEISSNSD